MKLVSIKYSEFEGHSNEWKLDELQLFDVNLIVGKNADGKSRTVNLINGLSKLILTPNLVVSHGHYYATFDDKGKNIHYEIAIFNSLIVKELLAVDEDIFIERGADGSGKMMNIEANLQLKVKLAQKNLAISRRDEVQYPYLEPIYRWATNVIHFAFNTELGRNNYLLLESDKPLGINIKDTQTVASAFLMGKKYSDGRFKKLIIELFNKVGYHITDIDCAPPVGLPIKFENSGPQTVGLRVKENDVKAMVEQHYMSTGMFRALAVIIYFCYYIVTKHSGLILIDDIGEGLDYERSSNLIKILIEESNANNIQLVMTTNDRFVMNNVSLDYWQIISRNSGQVRMNNHVNSKEIFEEFKFTGLNNFDFFATGFFKDGFENETSN